MKRVLSMFKSVESRGRRKKNVDEREKRKHRQRQREREREREGWMNAIINWMARIIAEIIELTKPFVGSPVSGRIELSQKDRNGYDRIFKWLVKWMI